MRIAIVNDLSLAREVLRRLVLSVPGQVVAWMAENGEEAVQRATLDPPDAILMDLVMPGVNGVDATRRIMKQSPCPILVVTATLTGNYDLVIQAMAAGALDAVETPSFGSNGTIQNGSPILARLAKLADAKRGAIWTGVPKMQPGTRSPISIPSLVLIGSSTGGPDALAAVLSAFPRDFPACVVIAQHIGVEFAPSLATWLSTRCLLPVKTAEEGESLKPGRVLIAASNDHLVLGTDLKLRYSATPIDYPYRPSADVLFSSAADSAPPSGVAILLTGMGSDGAEGLLQLRSRGWHTIAQDESTSIVYGMPKAAAERRAASEILPLSLIGPTVLARVMRGR